MKNDLTLEDIDRAVEAARKHGKEKAVLKPIELGGKLWYLVVDGTLAGLVDLPKK